MSKTKTKWIEDEAVTPPKISQFNAGSTAEKSSPVNADRVLIDDSADSYNKKWAQVGNLPGGGGADEKAKVSSNDTTAGYLNGKLVAGTGVTLTENNDGGDETLSVALASSGINMAAAQIRRTTDFSIVNTTPTDVPFDTTDVETNPSVIEHDDGNTDRILIKETGLYWGYYGGRAYISSTRNIYGRVRIDDTTVIPGSYQEYKDITGVADDYAPTFNKGFLFEATAGQYVTFQVWKNATGGTHELKDFSFKVVKFEGSPVGISSYGELYEDNDSGTDLVLGTAGQWYKWITSAAGESAGSDFVEQDTVNDKLIIGHQGAGTYMLHAFFAGSISSAAILSMAVYKNGTRLGQFETHDQKGSGQSLDLGVSGLIPLTEDDELDLRFKSNQTNVTVTINKISLALGRVTAGANAASFAQTVTSWTSDSGLYRADIDHNLGTEDLVVQGYLTSNKKNIGFEDIERLNSNTVRVWVASEENVRVVVTSSGGSSGGGAASANPSFSFQADQLQSPNTSDWAVNALAPLSADSNNSGLSVRMFDDATEEGVGCTISVPSGMTDVKIKIRSRAETAPGAARTVGVKLYNRGIPDNGAVESWTAGTALSDVDIPTNEYFQYDEQTIALSTLGVTAGETTQFEFTRVNPQAGTELTGDWNLLELGLEFS